MITPDLPAEGLRIGRYSHAELSAMRGRRGRKPPEFYQLFPELKKAEATSRVPARQSPVEQSPVEQAPDPDGLAQRLRLASPAVRRLVEALLALPELAAASSGKLAERSVRVPVAALAADDVLTTDVSPVADGPQAANVDAHIVAISTALEAEIGPLPLRDPVYADPDSEAALGIG